MLEILCKAMYLYVPICASGAIAGTVPGISGMVDVDVAYFGYNGTETAKDTSERETASAN